MKTSGRMWRDETERTRVVSPDARIRLARQLVLRCSVDRLTGEGSKRRVVVGDKDRPHTAATNYQRHTLQSPIPLHSSFFSVVCVCSTETPAVSTTRSRSSFQASSLSENDVEGQGKLMIKGLQLHWGARLALGGGVDRQTNTAQYDALFSSTQGVYASNPCAGPTKQWLPERWMKKQARKVGSLLGFIPCDSPNRPRGRAACQHSGAELVRLEGQSSYGSTISERTVMMSSNVGRHSESLGPQP